MNAQPRSIIANRLSAIAACVLCYAHFVWLKPPSSEDIASIGPRQPQHPLTNVILDHLSTDGRNARYEDLPQIPLHMILFGISHPTVRHHGPLTRLKSSLGGQVLCGICIFPALVPSIIHPGRLVDHQPCSLELHPTIRQGMLNRLVLPNRPSKYLSFSCI